MIASIADILKHKLSAFPWLERYTGLVVPASRPVIVQDKATGVQTAGAQQVYPISCEASTENCWETGHFKTFEPDSKKAAIAFFTDGGGATLRAVEGPKRERLRFSFSLRLLFWMNMRRLGNTLPENSCYASGILAPYVAAQMFGEHDTDAALSDRIDAGIYRQVEVTGVRQLARDPNMFAPFTFAQEGQKRGLFIYPYDFFGLQLDGQFIMPSGCLPQIETILSNFACIDHDAEPWLGEDLSPWQVEPAWT